MLRARYCACELGFPACTEVLGGTPSKAGGRNFTRWRCVSDCARGCAQGTASTCARFPGGVAHWRHARFAQHQRVQTVAIISVTIPIVAQGTSLAAAVTRAFLWGVSGSFPCARASAPFVSSSKQPLRNKAFRLRRAGPRFRRALTPKCRFTHVPRDGVSPLCPLTRICIYVYTCLYMCTYLHNACMCVCLCYIVCSYIRTRTYTPACA